MSSPPAHQPGSVARTFLTLGSGDALARIISFGAFVYLARALGAEAFGTIELAAAVVLYGNRIVDLGFDLGLGVRESAAGDDAARASLLKTGLTLRAASGIVVIALFAVIGLVLLPSPEGEVLALYGTTLAAVAIGVRWLHLGMERSRLVAIARIIGELTMVVTVLLVVRTADDLLRVPVARLVGDMLAATLLLIGARRLVRSRGRFDSNLAKRLIPRALPLVGSSIYGLMIFNADLVFLRVFEGRAAVGFYAAAYALTSFLSNLGTAYQLSLLPSMVRLTDRPSERTDLYHAAHAQVMAIALAIATGGTMLAAPIVALVFGPEYSASALPLALVLWSVPLGVMRELPVTALMAEERERPIQRITAQAAGVNIGLNFLLVPFWGMAGAAIATVVTEGCRWWLAARQTRLLGLEGPPIPRYWRGALAAAGMAVTLYLAGSLALWLSILTGSLVWILLMFVVGGIRRRKDGGFSLEV